MTRLNLTLMLDRAIEGEDWETVALVVLYRTVRKMRRVPPETLEEMVTLLSDEIDRPFRRRTRKPSRAN